MSQLHRQLIALSRNLGKQKRRLAILGEGNASCRVSDETFLIKSSGSSLRSLKTDDVTECRFQPLLELLDRPEADDQIIAQVLLDSRVSHKSRRPSTEAVFHAYLLTLPDVHWVGHVHPVAVNGILCSPRAPDFAARRMFPDEIVCCGRSSLLIPYTDPGLPLARAVKKGMEVYHQDAGTLPRIILLANHGLIAPASTAAGIMAATLMATKAAEIFTLAATHGGPTFLEQPNVDRIESRNDEHYRRKQLGI